MNAHCQKDSLKQSTISNRNSGSLKLSFNFDACALPERQSETGCNFKPRHRLGLNYTDAPCEMLAEDTANRNMSDSCKMHAALIAQLSGPSHGFVCLLFYILATANLQIRSPTSEKKSQTP